MIRKNAPSARETRAARRGEIAALQVRLESQDRLAELRAQLAQAQAEVRVLQVESPAQAELRAQQIRAELRAELAQIARDSEIEKARIQATLAVLKEEEMEERRAKNADLKAEPKKFQRDLPDLPIQKVTYVASLPRNPDQSEHLPVNSVTSKTSEVEAESEALEEEEKAERGHPVVHQDDGPEIPRARGGDSAHVLGGDLPAIPDEAERGHPVVHQDDGPEIPRARGGDSAHVLGGGLPAIPDKAERGHPVVHQDDEPEIPRARGGDSAHVLGLDLPAIPNKAERGHPVVHQDNGPEIPSVGRRDSAHVLGRDLPANRETSDQAKTSHPAVTQNHENRRRQMMSHSATQLYDKFETPGGWHEASARVCQGGLIQPSEATIEPEPPPSPPVLRDLAAALSQPKDRPALASFPFKGGGAK